MVGTWQLGERGTLRGWDCKDRCDSVSELEDRDEEI